MSALDAVGSKITESAELILLFAKIAKGLEQISTSVCSIATSAMNVYASEDFANMEILQQDMSNLSKTREQMLTVMQRIDKTVETKR